MIQLGVGRIGTLILLGAVILCCSCEKHQLDELPAVQREHVELANPSAATENPDVVKERPAECNATPAEFFPSATPH